MAFPENREIIENLRPESAADWLLVAGDVAERFEEASLGYPREWQAGGRGPGRPRQILPPPGSPE